MKVSNLIKIAPLSALIIAVGCNSASNENNTSFLSENGTEIEEEQVENTSISILEKFTLPDLAYDKLSKKFEINSTDTRNIENIFIDNNLLIWVDNHNTKSNYTLIDKDTNLKLDKEVLDFDKKFGDFYLAVVDNSGTNDYYAVKRVDETKVLLFKKLPLSSLENLEKITLNSYYDKGDKKFVSITDTLDTVSYLFKLLSHKEDVSKKISNLIVYTQSDLDLDQNGITDKAGLYFLKFEDKAPAFEVLGSVDVSATMKDIGNVNDVFYAGEDGKNYYIVVDVKNSSTSNNDAYLLKIDKTSYAVERALIKDNLKVDAVYDAGDFFFLKSGGTLYAVSKVDGSIAKTYSLPSSNVKNILKLSSSKYLITYDDNKFQVLNTATDELKSDESLPASTYKSYAFTLENNTYAINFDTSSNKIYVYKVNLDGFTLLINFEGNYQKVIGNRFIKYLIPHPSTPAEQMGFYDILTNTFHKATSGKIVNNKIYALQKDPLSIEIKLDDSNKESEYALVEKVYYPLDNKILLENMNSTLLNFYDYVKGAYKTEPYFIANDYYAVVKDGANKYKLIDRKTNATEREYEVLASSNIKINFNEKENSIAITDTFNHFVDVITDKVESLSIPEFVDASSIKDGKYIFVFGEDLDNTYKLKMYDIDTRKVIKEVKVQVPGTVESIDRLVRRGDYLIAEVKTKISGTNFYYYLIFDKDINFVRGVLGSNVVAGKDINEIGEDGIYVFDYANQVEKVYYYDGRYKENPLNSYFVFKGGESYKYGVYNRNQIYECIYEDVNNITRCDIYQVDSSKYLGQINVKGYIYNFVKDKIFVK